MEDKPVMPPNIVGQPERVIQNRVIVLFRDIVVATLQPRAQSAPYRADPPELP